MKRKILEKIVKWILFSVILALLPLLFNLLRLYIRGTDISIESLIPNGELFLVSAVIAASSIGDLIVSNPSQIIPKIIVGGGSIINLIFTSFLFAEFTNNEITISNFNIDNYFFLSISLFLFTVLTALSCIILAEVKNEL